MPTYSIQAPDGKTYSIDGPPDASKDDIVRAINYKLYGLPKPEAPPPGAASTFLKSMGMGSIPGAAGLKAFAETTAVAAPEMGPWALIPGLAAAGLTTWGTSKAQDALLQKTGLDKALGVDEESMAKGEKAHPYASLLGEFAAQLETMEPNFKGLKSIKGLSEDLAKEVLEARKTAAANAAIGAVTTAAQQGAFNDGNVDWTDVAKSAALGAILGKPNRFGRYVEGFGHAPKVTPPVGPAVTPEEKAGEYDFLSSAIPSRQKPVEPAQAPIPDWLASNEDIPSYFLKKPPPEPSLQQEPLPSWLTPQANETPAWLYKNPDDFTNPQLPLTRDVTQPNDLFRTHQPIELGGQQPQEPVDLMSRPDSELTDDELAQKNALTRQQGVQQGQMGFPYPRTPMNELAPRERVLQAMRIEEDTKTIKNLQDATGLRPMELRAELNKLKNEGVVGYNAREHEWEFTNKPAEEPAELPAQKDVPTQQEVENLVEEKSDLPAQKDVPTREDVEQLLKEEPAAEQPAAEQPAAEQPAAEEAPKVKKTAKPVEEKVAPITRSENAINALREGNLGKALYHLI